MCGGIYLIIVLNYVIINYSNFILRLLRMSRPPCGHPRVGPACAPRRRRRHRPSLPTAPHTNPPVPPACSAAAGRLPVSARSGLEEVASRIVADFRAAAALLSAWGATGPAFFVSLIRALQAGGLGEAFSRLREARARQSCLWEPATCGCGGTQCRPRGPGTFQLAGSGRAAFRCWASGRKPGTWRSLQGSGHPPRIWSTV